MLYTAPFWLAKSAGLLSKIYTHRFNQQLCDGSLSQEAFAFYLSQDAIYLGRFSKALSIISERFDERCYRSQFKQLANQIVSAELKLQTQYLKKKHSPYFFYPHQPVGVTQLPVIARYTQHLLLSAERAPIEAAVVSCLPCFFIYHQLGTQMNARCQRNNPYRHWIASYSSPTFSSSTLALMDTTKKLTQTVTSPILQEKITQSFEQSTQYELDFFDAIPSLTGLEFDFLKQKGHQRGR